jgi:DNA-directed RNA polymerase specialized sigma subunit
MTAKEYLSQARYLDARINTKIKQLEALNTLATSATSVLTGMPHSPNKATSKMADIVDKIVDLQAEINRDIDALVDLKGEMRSKLEMVPAEDYKAILEMRYLCFMSWEQIASNLGLSVPYTYKLHDRALKGFESRAM